MKESLRQFFEMAPYLLLGLLFVGLFHIFFSKDIILKYVGKNDIRSVLNAALVGVPLPLCSCGVIPTSVFMARNGASRGSVMSFLISTPQTGVDSMIATFGMLGWVFAIFRPIAAFIMGILGGISLRFFDKESNFLEGNESDKSKLFQPLISPNKAESEIRKSAGWGIIFISKLEKMYKYAFVEFLDDIAIQFIFGIIISGIITYFIPDSFFRNTSVNNGILGMLLMVAVGIPMYVCATASIPIAITLIMKGFSPGVAFVFLASGPATNAASLAILSKTMGRKFAALFVLIITISSIAFGYLLDFIFTFFNLDPHELMNHSTHLHFKNFGTMDFIYATALGLLLFGSIYRKYILIYFNRSKPMDNKQIFNIEGMSCNHCVMNVTKAINGVQGVESVSVVLNENKAYIEGNIKRQEVINAIHGVGYTVVE
ncbi:MAG: SO_0444 family Cu/Zn efflux transporter [Candidatus Kapabacteria bacterium]|nr:SO_0444 family Cu/Zn efflux transporter [Candidatus Kapabacteria bacterium]